MDIKAFKVWLDSRSLDAFEFSRDKRLLVDYRIIRFARNDDIDMLFQLPDLRFPASVHGDGKATYVGLYNRKTGKLYDVQYNMRYHFRFDDEFAELMEESTPTKEDLGVAVSNAVNEIIGNDRTRLDIKELSAVDKQNINENDAGNQARRLFLEKEETLNDIPYSCCYLLREALTEDEWILCLTDMPAFARQTAQKYIEEHQESILRAFLFNDMIWKHYLEIVQNPDTPLHMVKKIRYAVKNASAKSVNVTIYKDGHEETFKTGTWVFQKFDTYYSCYDMPSADRLRFEKLFGRSAVYYPHEIVKITYGKKTLYENESISSQKH